MNQLAATTSMRVAIVATTAPVLGAIADRIVGRKTMLGALQGVSTMATASMALIHRGDPALASPFAD